MADRKIKAAPITPELLSDAYLLPRARNGASTVTWMEGADVCDPWSSPCFDFETVCATWCLFQGRQDIEWVVTSQEETFGRFTSWLAVAGPNSIRRGESRLYDALWGTGEILRPGRFDSWKAQTPELSAIYEYGSPLMNGVLRTRKSRLHRRRRVPHYAWVEWPLRNVTILKGSDG